MKSPIIECTKLSHVYSGKFALNDLTFQLDAGEPIGLVGPNGAGKTTLLSILSGFLRPTSGQAKLFGQSPGAAQLIGKVSALPQDARLDPSFTVLEQLVFYGRLQGIAKQQALYEANRVLEAVALQDIARSRPVVLSHGMAKRVAIAQALIGQPELVLLDEPTAGLDPVNVRTVRSIIAEQSPKTTFLISSHDLSELDRLCQQVLLLEKGVLRTESIATDEQQANVRFITLQMEACPSDQVIAAIQALRGVVRVSSPQKNEFVIAYDPGLEANMDVSLMQSMNANAWRYRQLSHGKTLEEKLFFRDK